MVMFIKRAAGFILMLFSMATVVNASSSLGESHDIGEPGSTRAKEKASHDSGGHKESSSHGNSHAKKSSHDSGSHKKTSSHGSSQANKASHDSSRHYKTASHGGDLSGVYEMCKAGMNQSPISIDATSDREMDGISFSYASTGLRVLNNGHTVQVNRNGESHMSIAGEDYRLLQFHFHSPSEHQRNGNPYPMEVHFVHQNDEGRQAIVGVFVEEGGKNTEMDKVLRNVPSAHNKEQAFSKLSINPSDLLPSDHSYVHYNGSLTTPPCSEGVRWFVMESTIKISSMQVTSFLSMVGENARPTQPMNNRVAKR